MLVLANGGGMATLPDHILTAILQRQRQRSRCAHIIETLLDDQRLTAMAPQFLKTGSALLAEDQCDLNGTPGMRAAITVEQEAWQGLQRALIGAPAVSADEARRAREHLETIKRVIDVEATLIELAIPAATPAPLQVLYDEYQQRYGDPTIKE